MKPEPASRARSIQALDAMSRTRMNPMKAVVALFFLLTPLAAHANGAKLLEWCKVVENRMDTKAPVTDQFAAGKCLGLVQGVNNTMILTNALLEPQHRLCFPPDGIDNGQAVRIVLKYLRAHPEDLSRSESALASLAFREAFKCPDGA